MTEHVFLTGATGFIGARVLEKWLRDTTAHVTCLVRPRRGVSSTGSLQRALAPLGINRDDTPLWRRITIVEGSLESEYLGLSRSEHEHLTRTISHIIHCGALVRFDLPLDQTRRVNTGGTRTTIDLASRCDKLRRFDYVSTAYVSGRRTGCIREDELLKGHAFNNSYEQSKFEAEKLVSLVGDRLPVTVYRPSIVICDARSGYFPPNGAFTRLLKAYAVGELTCLPSEPTVALDLVTADFIVDAIHALALDDTTIGRRFHLCAGKDNLTTMAEIIESASRYFNRERLILLSPEDFERFRSRAKTNGKLSDHLLLAELDIYVSYLNNTLHFDDTNARASLEKTGIRAPRFNGYFAKMADRVKLGH